MKPGSKRPFSPTLRGVDVETLLVTEIEVTVEPNGSLGNAFVFKSSGNRSFDLAVIRAARLSTYKSKVVNCQPVEGIYLFRGVTRPR